MKALRGCLALAIVGTGIGLGGFAPRFAEGQALERADTISAASPAAPGRLTLEETARRALAHFPTVRGARHAVAAAAGAEGEEKAARFPAVKLSASATRYEEPSIVHPIHAFGPGTFPPLSRTVAQGGIGVSYLLFDGGGRGGRIREASRREDAARAALAGSEMELLQQVTVKYVEVLTRRTLLGAHDARLIALRAERDRVGKELRAGRAARVDSLRMESVVAAAEAERVALEADLHLSERDLTGLTGIARDSTRAAGLVAVTLVPDAPPDSAIAQALSRSSDVREAGERARAAWAGAAASRGSRWPQLTAAGNYQVWSDPDGNSTGEWNAALLLSQALFTGGEITNRIHRREALAHQADEDLRLARITTGRAVQAALDRAEAASARRASLVVAVAGYQEVARIEALSLSAGAGTQTDFLRAEADLLGARANLAEAEMAEIAARVELARLSGDLTLGWLAANLEDTP